MNSRLRVFFISLTLVFLMVALPHVGLHTTMFSPLPSKIDSFDRVIPKLDQVKNYYQIKKHPALVEGALASSDFDLAKSYIVTNFDTGEIIAEKDGGEKLPIASVTKIMSALVALDLASPSEMFSVSRKAAQETPTRLALSVGDQLSLEELLNAALLTSANDCAEVIKEGIDQKYGEGTFIRAMNTKAKLLGLTSSFFTNPQGFDDGNPYSSSEDLAVLAHYALTNYPLIAAIVSRDHGELTPTPTHHKYEYLNNWNGLVGVYPGIEGVKIGDTDMAGNTTVVVSERGGKKILVVLLGAPGVLERDMWAAELLDSGFSHYGLDPVNINQSQLMAKYSTWKYFN